MNKQRKPPTPTPNNEDQMILENGLSKNSNMLLFLADIYRVVGKMTCNKILQELQVGELTYSELKYRTRLSQGSFTNAIKQLMDKHLIEKRVDLKRSTFYKISNVGENIGIRKMLDGIREDGPVEKESDEHIVHRLRSVLPTN